MSMSSLHLSLGFQYLAKPDNAPFLVHPSEEEIGPDFGTSLVRNGGISQNGRPPHQYSGAHHANAAPHDDVDGLNDLNFLTDLQPNMPTTEELVRLPLHSSPFHDGDFNSTMDLFQILPPARLGPRTNLPGNHLPMPPMAMPMNMNMKQSTDFSQGMFSPPRPHNFPPQPHAAAQHLGVNGLPGGSEEEDLRFREEQRAEVSCYVFILMV